MSRQVKFFIFLMVFGLGWEAFLIYLYDLKALAVGEMGPVLWILAILVSDRLSEIQRRRPVVPQVQIPGLYQPRVLTEDDLRHFSPEERKIAESMYPVERRKTAWQHLFDRDDQ